jgi:hypothetical protein
MIVVDYPRYLPKIHHDHEISMRLGGRAPTAVRSRAGRLLWR